MISRTLALRAAKAALVFLFLFVTSAGYAQIRQLHLYIDDGTGHFTILSSSGTGTLTLPTGTGTLMMEPLASPAGPGVILQGLTPGTQQTGNLNISGAGIFGGALTVTGTIHTTDIEDVVGLTINTVLGKNTTIGNSTGTTSIAGSNWSVAGLSGNISTSGTINVGGTSTIATGNSLTNTFGSGTGTTNTIGAGGTLANPTFPATNASGVLTNNGSGGLSWVTPSGFTAAYFNAYTTSVATTIAAGVEVPVTTVGASSGFTSDGSGGFTVSATGVYNVEYTVARDEASAFAITINNTEAAGSEFGCATGTTIIHGNVILSLTAADVIRLIASPNNVSAVTMESISPGNTVEASLTAIRIQ